MVRLIKNKMMLHRLHFKHTHKLQSKQHWTYSRQPSECLTEAALFRHNDQHNFKWIHHRSKVKRFQNSPSFGQNWKWTHHRKKVELGQNSNTQLLLVSSAHNRRDKCFLNTLVMAGHLLAGCTSTMLITKVCQPLCCTKHAKVRLRREHRLVVSPSRQLVLIRLVAAIVKQRKWPNNVKLSFNCYFCVSDTKTKPERIKQQSLQNSIEYSPPINCKTKKVG